jgi:hypothetical protein
VGSAFINNGKVEETYHKYTTQGNLIETRTLFPTRDYAIFSGVFDETGQTTFEFDLTVLTITDGILVISSRHYIHYYSSLFPCCGFKYSPVSGIQFL